MASPTPQALKVFRETFPEITEDKYPDAAVRIRLSLADKFFAVDRFEDAEVRAHVMGLYAAHYLTAYGSTASSGNGNGGTLGVVASKSVDGASVSYDTSTGTEEGAGFWNMTAYGRELYQLMQIFGAGGIQI